MEKSLTMSIEMTQKEAILATFVQWLRSYKTKFSESLVTQIGDALLETLTSSTLILTRLYQSKIVEHETLMPLVIEGILLSVDLLIDYGYNLPLVKEMLWFIEENFVKENALFAFVSNNLFSAEQYTEFTQHINQLKQFYSLKRHWRVESLSCYENYENVFRKFGEFNASITEEILTPFENDYIYLRSLKALTHGTLKPEKIDKTKNPQILALSIWYRHAILDNIGIDNKKVWNYLEQFVISVSTITSKNKPLWRSNCQKLEDLRATLKKQLNLSPEQAIQAMAEFNQGLTNFTVDLLQTCETMLGESPFKFCVLALGSLSQDMLCAYSDIELALLVNRADCCEWDGPENELTTEAFYIKSLMELFEFMVLSLGEKDKGYQLDNNSQPRTEPSLRGTSEQLVGYCLAQELESHDGLVYSLLHAKPLYGDRNLFDTFHDQIHQVIVRPCKEPDNYLAFTKNVPLTWHQYWALAQFKRNLKEYNKYVVVERKETPDLKKPYLKLLRFIMQDLALYLNLPAQDFSQACEQLVAGGYLPTDVIETIKQHVNYLLIERNKRHLTLCKEEDSALPEHQVPLEQIRRRFLAPYFDTIHILENKGYALWQQAFWLACVPQYLSPQKTSAALTLLEKGLSKKTFYLPLAMVKKIFEDNGKIKTTVSGRNSAVFEWGPYYLKIQLPDEPQLEVQERALQVFIAREYVVNQFSRSLGWTVTPEGCAIKLAFKTTPGQVFIYYGWLSQRLVGRDLDNVKQEQPDLLKSISTEDYTALFLLSLLTYPEDGQPRNFIISTQTLGAKNQSARLYSIDNKRVFINPIEVINNKINSKKKLNLKTCLYTLPNFYQILNTKVWKACQQLDLSRVRHTLLETIKDFDKIVQRIGTIRPVQKDLQEHGFSALAIPLYMLYSVVIKLEQLLQCFPDANALPLAANVLKQCEPEIYNLCNDLFLTDDYYQTFEANYRRNESKQMFSKASLNFIRDNKIKAKALGQELLKAYPKFAMSINWEILSKEYQVYWLELFQKQSLTEINLAHCSKLENETLIEILKKSTYLTFLNISKCKDINQKIFEKLSQYCKWLDTLILDDNLQLTEIRDLKLPQLTTLSVKRCNNLVNINLTKCPNLKYLYCEGTHINVSNADIYTKEFNERGRAKLEKKDYAAALEDFIEAARLNPNESAYHYNCGLGQKSLGKYDLAILDYSEAIRLKPEVANYHAARGDAYFSLIKYSEAINDYSEAIRLKPEIANYHAARGNAYYHLGEYELAIEDGNKVIQLSDNDFSTDNTLEVYTMLGCIYFFLDKYEDAIKIFSESLNLINDKDHIALLLSNRAECYMKVNEINKAHTDLIQALAIVPQHKVHANVNYLLGKIYIKGLVQNQLNSAKVNFEKALTIFLKNLQQAPDDTNAMAKYYLGRICEMGYVTQINLDEAVIYYRRAINNQDSLFYRKKAYHRLLDMRKSGIDIGSYPLTKPQAPSFSSMGSEHLIRKELVQKSIQIGKNRVPPTIKLLAKNFSQTFDKQSSNESVQKTVSKVSNINLPQLYFVKMNDQSVTFERKEVLGDGDCGYYTAFRITRAEAYRSLIFNLNVVRSILKPALQEILRLQAFKNALQRQGRLTQALAQAYANYVELSNAGGEILQSTLDDLTILRAYIDYDVKDKEIDDGWSHPCILFALAEIQGIELNIWKLNDQGKLVPHQQYPHHIPTQATDKRTDLIFVNGNHFERLEIIKKDIYYPNFNFK